VTQNKTNKQSLYDSAIYYSHLFFDKCKTFYGINFDAPNAHFDKLRFFNDAQVKKFGNPN
jgi:hypothetical protein